MKTTTDKKLCDIRGPKGGKRRVGVLPGGFIRISGMEPKGFFPYKEVLEQRIPNKGDRRRIRRRLYAAGFRNAAQWSVRPLPF